VLLASKTPGKSTELTRLQSRSRRFLLFMVVWTIFVGLALWWLLRPAVSEGAVPLIMHRGDATPLSFAERVRDWFRLADLNFQRIYPWILLGPYVGWLAWAYSLERGRLRLSLPVHLVACALFVLASYAINTRSSMRVARVVIITSLRDEQLFPGEATNQIRVEVSESASGGIAGETFTKGMFSRHFDGKSAPDVLTLNPTEYAGFQYTNHFFKGGHGLQPPFGAPELPSMRPLTTLLDLFAYGAIVGMAHSVHFYRRYREREHRTLFLESNLAKARLGALQAQLQPHFLFNSLNAVVALVRRDPKLAEATLTSLSDLLRLTLSQSERQEVSLREELAFVRRYMEIQQTRFGDHLRFEQEIEPATLECLVPTLVLQPVVENAIRHGIEPAENTGVVRLVVRRQENRLVLLVEDDGVGLRETDNGEAAVPCVPGTGIGLANLRARLEALYGAQQSLQLNSREPSGVSVHIEIPYRQEGAAGSRQIEENE
jgi:two-component sensor histidine kinase